MQSSNLALTAEDSRLFSIIKYILLKVHLKAYYSNLQLLRLKFLFYRVSALKLHLKTVYFESQAAKFKFLFPT